MKFGLTVSGLIFAATAALAGPFGVTMGAPVSTYGGRPLVGSAYKITAPQPNLEFESYSAIATPATGICKVWGTGRDHDNDAYGADVRAAYARIKQALDSKYGHSEEIARLKPGALWGEDREWVMSLRQKERTHIAFWTGSGRQLPDGIVGISLEIKATSSSSAYLDLTYEFANFSQCKQSFLQKESSGL